MEQMPTWLEIGMGSKQLKKRMDIVLSLIRIKPLARHPFKMMLWCLTGNMAIQRNPPCPVSLGDGY